MSRRQGASDDAKKASRRYVAPTEVRGAMGDPLLNTAKAAALLGMSVSELKRRADRGDVACEVDARGWRWFSADALRRMRAAERTPSASYERTRGPAGEDGAAAPPPARLRRPYPGKLAQEVFKLLEEGVRAVDIVVRLGVHPKMVEAMREDWAQLKGGFFVNEQEREMIEGLPFNGERPIADVARLVVLLGNALRSGGLCVCCHSRRARVCSTCTSEVATAQWSAALLGSGASPGLRGDRPPSDGNVPRPEPRTPVDSAARPSGDRGLAAPHVEVREVPPRRE